MTEITNPNVSLVELQVLEQKIRANIADVNDYEKLNDYLAMLGFRNYIMDRFKEDGILSYSEYLLHKNNLSSTKNRLANTVLHGFILGSIEAVKDYMIRKKI